MPLSTINTSAIANGAVQRQLIRDKYVVIQAAVDAATTPDEIKAALEQP
jgi:hypothetical protein